MLDAIDEDGGGTVDLGEFIGKVTEARGEVTADDALDAAFDCFDVERKGTSSSRTSRAPRDASGITSRATNSTS